MPVDSKQTGDQLIGLLLNVPLSRTVEQTSELVKRWYILERGCMRAMAGWLPGIESQEIKLLLARHIWMDATAAGELRQRMLQLRYPRRDVDRNWDAVVNEFTLSVGNAPDDLCFVAGIYRVLKKAAAGAYQQAIGQCERVGDSPTCWLLEQLLNKTRRELDEMLPLLKSAETRSQAGENRREQWTEYLGVVLAAIGGVNAAAEQKDMPVDRSLEKPFQRTMSAARDPRYRKRCELMTHHPMFWEADNPGLRWLSYAVGHMNEMWAAETAAALIYDHSDAPWELLLDAARWCYDEARHTQMGLTRLQRAGFDIYHDLPAPEAVTFDCYEPDHLFERMLSIHCFERGGVIERTKQAAMKWHRQAGDQEGGHHYDFDWADESIHLQYGLEWMKHLYGEQILDADFDRRLNEAVEYRHQFLKELAPVEERRVEQHFRELCERINVPFKVKAVENFKGRE